MADQENKKTDAGNAAKDPGTGRNNGTDHGAGSGNAMTGASGAGGGNGSKDNNDPAATEASKSAEKLGNEAKNTAGEIAGAAAGAGSATDGDKTDNGSGGKGGGDKDGGDNGGSGGGGAVKAGLGAAGQSLVSGGGKKDDSDDPAGTEASKEAEELGNEVKKAAEKGTEAAVRAGLAAATGGASEASPLGRIAAKAITKIIMFLIGVLIFFVLLVASLFNVILYELGFDSAKDYAEASYEAQSDVIQEQLIKTFGGDDDDAASARKKVDDAFADHVLDRIYDEIEDDYETYAESKGLPTDPDDEEYVGYTVTSEYDTFWDGEYVEFFSTAIEELATEDELQNIQTGTGMWSADDPSLEYFIDCLLTQTQYNNATHRWATWDVYDPNGGESETGSRIYYKYLGSSSGGLIRGTKYYADEIESGALAASVAKQVKDSYASSPELWEVGTETAAGDIYEPNVYENAAASENIWQAATDYMEGMLEGSASGGILENGNYTEQPREYAIYLAGYASHSLEISDDAQFETVEDDDSLERATALLRFVTGENPDSNGDVFGIFEKDNFVGAFARFARSAWNRVVGLTEVAYYSTWLGQSSREEIRADIGQHEMNQLSEFVSWQNIEGVSENGYLSSNGMWDTSLGSRAAEASLAYKDWKYSQEKRTSDGYVDCSSLCFRAYRDAGLANLWGMTAASEAKYCAESGMEILDPTDLRAGDLIFSTSGSTGRYRNVTHVGMYLGDYKGDGKNYVINATNPTRNVVIQEFNAYIGCRTVVMYGRPYVAMLSIESQADVYEFLVGCGFTPAGACGVMGNIQVESGFRSTAISASKTYYGLCQWGGGRKDNLKAYCEKNGLDYTSVTGQMNFLIYEMQSSTSYKKAYDYMKTATDPEQAAQEFAVGIEGCVGKAGSGDAVYTGTLYSGAKGKYYQALGKRESWAQTFYNQYAD